MSSSQSSQRGKPSIVAPGLSDEARRAINGAFDALSDWRNEIASVAERNSATVFDKMGTAAKAMGWPAEFVDMTRQQMQQGSKMQLQMMDQVMDIWERQMKSPGSPVSLPDAFMGKSMPFPGAFGSVGGSAQAFPGFPGFPAMPGFDFNMMSANPLQFWMQAAEMWHKSWQQAFSAWMDMQQATLERSRSTRR